MSDEAAFRAVLTENPTDATSRLVYADWLDEHDRPRDAALERVLAQPASDEMRLAYAEVCEREGDHERAEFVRVQVEIVKARTKQCDCRSDQVKGPNCRDRSILEARQRNWWLHSPIWASALTSSAIRLVDMTIDHAVFMGNLGLKALIVRGFIEKVRLPPADWFAHAHAIRQQHPITQLTLTTVPDTELTSVHPHAPFITTLKLVGGKFKTTLNEREIRVARTLNDGIFLATRQATEKLLALEFPGIQITLPAPIR